MFVNSNFLPMKLKKNIIDEMKEKISRLIASPKTTFIPVLFHIGGVKKEVIDANYFHRIIDIANFIKEED